MKIFNLAKIQDDAEDNMNKLFHNSFYDTETITYSNYNIDFSYFYASLSGLPKEELFNYVRM